MRAACGAIVVVGAVVAGCGGASSSGGGGCAPQPSGAVQITATGLDPKSLCIAPGGAVAFQNLDTVAHDIESGMSCTMLDLGSIAAGGSATATFPTTGTGSPVRCPFFDAGHSSDAAFQGSVTVSSGTGGGGGGGGY